MALHAFVAMPFGVKDGIDFNRIYDTLIRPALAAAGCEPFRADEEMRAGEIRRDLFQELLLADLVLVDLSIDNPNVWYELGVRHALRARGVVQILCRREHVPFDVASDRVLRYHEKDGAPDPLMLETDRARLTRFVTETLSSWQGWKVSPVYQLLPYLEEPDWKTLDVAGSSEFRVAYQSWETRIELARRRNRPGDIMLLAGETPSHALRSEARRCAGAALTRLGHFGLALEQYEAALAIDPEDLDSLRAVGLLLGLLSRHVEAEVWVRDLIDRHPRDPDCWALLGQVQRNEWLRRWRTADASADSAGTRAAAEDAQLAEAITPYQGAFTTDPTHLESGVAALLLRTLRAHLGGADDPSLPLATLAGGVHWACLSGLHRAPQDYHARAGLATFRLIADDPSGAIAAYRAACASPDRDAFALASTRAELALLAELGWHPEAVARAIAVLDQELARQPKPRAPRRVLLFSGHMIDRPGRPEPRFPPRCEPIAADAVSAALDQLEAGSEDIALAGAACGGDLLFCEGCLARGVPLTVHLPFGEGKFLDSSVNFAGGDWRERFFAVTRHPGVEVRVLERDLAPTPPNMSPHARNNTWMLNSALAFGPERVHFVTLWNGREGDGPGGTRDMVERVKRHSGAVRVLDTTRLW